MGLKKCWAKLAVACIDMAIRQHLLMNNTSNGRRVPAAGRRS